MQRNPKKVRKVVSLLTDPKPEFVSLVNHGANQTPFLSVKKDREDPEVLSKPTASVEEVSKVDKHDVGVAKITFDKASFPSEESVRTYMDNKNYSDYTISDNGKTFEVLGGPAEDFEGDAEPVSAVKGVTMHLARVRQKVAKSPDTSPVETAKNTLEQKDTPANTEVTKTAFAVDGTPAAEITRKYDQWYAMYSDGKTIESVVAEASVDGLPPGFSDIHMAFYVAISNAMRAGDDTAVRALGTEFTDLVLSLAKLFKTSPILAEKAMNTKVEESVGKSAGEQAAALINAVLDKSKAVKADAPADGKNPGSAPMGGTETNDKPPVPVETKTENEPGFTSDDKGVVDPKTSPDANPATTAAEPTATEAPAVSGTPLTPITTETLGVAFKAFGETFAKTLGESFSAALDKQSEKLTDLATRLDAVEGKSQTRKGADIDGGNVGETSQKSAEQIKREDQRSERQVRNRLGF